MTKLHRRGLIALAPLAAAPGLFPRAAAAQVRSIADTLAGDARFARFLDLLTRARAVEDFRAAAPLTLFAPVDGAFANAPAGVLQDLTGQSGSGPNSSDQERERLLALIRNHAVEGVVVLYPAPAATRRVRTLNGTDIEIAGDGSAVTLRNPAQGERPGSWGAPGLIVVPPAELAGPPIPASNGVIQPVSQLIWP